MATRSALITVMALRSPGVLRGRELLGSDPECGSRCERPDGGCDVPDTQTEVTVPVAAQLLDRPPDLGVYCSCRCATSAWGQPEAKRLCECPTGFICKDILQDMDFGADAYSGSYCVKFGSDILGSPATFSGGQRCNPKLEDCNR